MKQSILAVTAVLSLALLFPQPGHAQWNPNKRYKTVGEAILEGAPKGAKVTLENGQTFTVGDSQVTFSTRPAGSESAPASEGEAVGDAGTMNEGDATTLPATGGHPALLSLCGFLLATGAFLLRRKLT
jgi:hypothetical protein